MKKVLLLALVSGLMLSACATAAASRSQPPTLHSLRLMLLTKVDYSRGWHATKPIQQFGGGSGCPEVESEKQLLGTNAVEVFFHRPNSDAFSFEYLAYRRSTVDAFVKAITPIMTFASCAEKANGRVVDSSVSNGTIVTRTYGTWSTANLVTNTFHGTKSQLGYMFVRKSGFLLVIGYDNRGSLDLRDLEGLTRKAVSKIAST
jgi:hypothetical protein